MLTIGQLADIAGVSVRTVRHYHQLGLMPEPERDESGYRRYRSRDVVRLLRIRALADVGIPLARIEELLDAETQVVEDMLGELERELESQVRRLRARQARIARIRGTDPRLPPALRGLAATLRGAGFDDAAIAAERDAILLAEAIGERGTPTWTMGLFFADFEDPSQAERLLELWRRFDAVGDDDAAEAEELVDAFSELFRAHLQASGRGAGAPQPPDPLGQLLIADHVASLPRAQRRIVEAVSARFA